MTRFAAIYYFLLKLVAVAVVFAIPSAALIVAYLQLMMSPLVANWIHVVASFALFITTLSVIQILYIEIRYSFRVVKLYWIGELAD
jgi:hypothetical protein